MTRDEMNEILAKFNAVFDSFRIKDETTDVWHELFCDYDFDLVQKAATRVLETCQYAPKPNDLLGAIKFYSNKKKLQTFECTPQERKEYRDYLATKGIRVLPDGQYANVDDLHGNERKIDYVCRILGPAKVTAMLKEALGGSIFNVNPKAYKEFLNNVLIPMAEQDEKTPPKNWGFLD